MSSVRGKGLDGGPGAYGRRVIGSSGRADPSDVEGLRKGGFRDRDAPGVRQSYRLSLSSERLPSRYYLRRMPCLSGDVFTRPRPPSGRFRRLNACAGNLNCGVWRLGFLGFVRISRVAVSGRGVGRRGSTGRRMTALRRKPQDSEGAGFFEAVSRRRSAVFGVLRPYNGRRRCAHDRRLRQA